MNRDSEYLQNFDGDLIEKDFDEYDPLGERMTDDEERGHTMDNIILDYNNSNNKK